MLVSFLFWNVMKRPLQTHLARIVSHHRVNVVMVAECNIATNEIEAVLQESTGQPYYFSAPLSDTDRKEEKIQLFTTFQSEVIAPQFSEPMGRLVIRRFSIPGVPDTLLAMVHLVSLTNFDRDDQSDLAQIMAKDIIRAEMDTGISRTILVGDLNMNPFDRGVSSATGFHGVMTKQRAAQGNREVQGRSYRFFYNPMWGFFGDQTPGPAGTFHRSAGDSLNYFWNIYDQVLLRPELMEGLRALHILDSDSVESLVTPNGTPISSRISDHLPLFFQLEL